MRRALLILAVFAVLYACTDQTNDPPPVAVNNGNTAPASNCPSRCAAISASCGTDPTECSSLCTGITEGALECIENSECGDSSGCTSSADGGLGDADATFVEGGECTPLSAACRSDPECCGASCTNKTGSSDMVCCVQLQNACASDDDCCATHCSTSGKCCYGPSVPCTTDTAAQCCSGTCGSTGFCN